MFSGEVIMPGAAEIHERFFDALQSVARGTTAHYEVTVLVLAEPRVEVPHSSYCLLADQ
jgi:hypothetical protein